MQTWSREEDAALCRDATLAMDRLGLVVYDDTVDMIFNLASITLENDVDIDVKIDSV